MALNKCSPSSPSAEHIQTQMSVRQIYTRAEGELQDATSDQFTAVLYAMVSKFDIDGLATSINKKWQVVPNSPTLYYLL